MKDVQKQARRETGSARYQPANGRMKLGEISVPRLRAVTSLAVSRPKVEESNAQTAQIVFFFLSAHPWNASSRLEASRPRHLPTRSR